MEEKFRGQAEKVFLIKQLLEENITVKGLETQSVLPDADVEALPSGETTILLRFPGVIQGYMQLPQTAWVCSAARR